MTARDYLPVLPWVGTTVALIFAIGVSFKLCKIKSQDGKSGVINHNIDKSSPKVATVMDIEDLGEKTAFCRCWKSKKFPYCDGAHGPHNLACGDNVGPLVLKRKSA